MKQKTAWILAGKTTAAVVCLLVCIGSMWLAANRTARMFGLDPWQEFQKKLTFDMFVLWRTDIPPLFAAFLLGLAGTVVLWVLLFLCHDRVAELILLPICFLLPLHLVWSDPLIMTYTFYNPVLALMLAPVAIEAFAGRKRFLYLGTASGICAIYLLLSFIGSLYFWEAMGNRGD